MNTKCFLLGYLLIISEALSAQSFIDSLRVKAEQGDVAAMWKVGNYYDGAGKNDSAGYWLLKAYKIDKKNAKGLYYLGLFYGPSYEGKKYLKKSAELGNIKAALTLFKVSKPRYVPSLLDSNKEWKKFQNDEGECKRYASLALSLTPGEDFHSYIELADAADWINNVSLRQRYATIAFNKGEYGAIGYVARNKISLNGEISGERACQLADYLKEHRNELKIESDEWVSLYLKSAEKGYAPAQCQMGGYYLHGDWVEKDTLKALAWYKQSANQGNATARLMVASFYQQGLYCPKSPELAFTLLKQVADAEDTDMREIINTHANYHVGLCYYYGYGIKKDNLKALEYLLKARAIEDRLNRRTFMDIAYLMGIIYYEMNDTKALKYLKEYSDFPINTSNSLRKDAAIKISSCYKNGICGIARDILLSEKYDNQAAKYQESDNQNIQDLVMKRAYTYMSLLPRNNRL